MPSDSTSSPPNTDMNWSKPRSSLGGNHLPASGARETEPSAPSCTPLIRSPSASIPMTASLSPEPSSPNEENEAEMAVVEALDQLAINYRVQLDAKTILFWIEQCLKLKLSAERIGEATRWCLQDCARFPTWAEFVARLPKREDQAAPGLNDPVDSINDRRLDHGAPWWWNGVRRAIALTGAARVAVYQTLIAEAQHRGEPEYEWVESEVQRYVDKRGQRISVRCVTNCGWARWKTDDKGRLMSGHTCRPDRNVILKGSA